MNKSQSIRIHHWYTILPFSANKNFKVVYSDKINIKFHNASDDMKIDLSYFSLPILLIAQNLLARTK